MNLQLLRQLFVQADPHKETCLLDLVAGVECADQVDLTVNRHERICGLCPELQSHPAGAVKFKQGSQASEPRAEHYLQLVDVPRRVVDSLDSAVVGCLEPRRLQELDLGWR